MKILIFIVALICSSACLSADLKEAMCRCDELMNSKDEIVVTNDEFIAHFLETVLVWDGREANFGKMDVKRVYVSSTHTNGKNHIFIARDEKDFFSYYVGEGNRFPLCVVVTSSRLDEKNGVRIGQDFDFFSKKFGFKNYSEVVRVDSLEGGSFVRFSFFDKKLVSIEYRSNYVD